ncbi:MAG TPA: TetR/AcrR family transcriptional regulator [Holophaga sp.]|nr:TetR/AcrR family transcriptional regulator [Holophaga sp.]
MRVKTEARRQAILDTAAQVFREEGFERASMSAICERLGYSKATLYNYFQSKEELFSTVVFEATEAEWRATHEALDSSVENISQALALFGRRFLTILYSPDVQAMRRLMASEAGRSGLGKQYYDRGTARSQTDIADFLQRAMDAGKLRQGNAWFAALHLVGLLESEWSPCFLFQTLETISAEAIHATVERAVGAFLGAYGPHALDALDGNP